MRHNYANEIHELIYELMHHVLGFGYAKFKPIAKTYKSD